MVRSSNCDETYQALAFQEVWIVISRLHNLHFTEITTIDQQPHDITSLAVE